MELNPEDPYARLVEAVRAAKAGKPLRPVTVVTSGFAVARDVLRHLARAGGVANTNVVTSAQLAQSLAQPVLAPRTALPYPLLVGSVRRVLGERPGLFAQVAGEPVTARALATASQWIGGHPPRSAEGFGPVVEEVLRIHAAATSSHGDRHFLPHELFAAATQRLDTLGERIVFLPCEQDPAAAEFLREVGVGTVVDTDGQATGTLVLHASDADDEVRAIARLVRNRLAAGTPGHRIGVFYGSDTSYLASILAHFDAANISVCGPAARSLADSAAARSLLRLLGMDPHAIGRRELLAVLAERAVRWQGEPTFSTRQAEILTRKRVPIVGGADWARLRTVAPDERGYDTAQGLLALIESLRSSLGAVTDARSWPDVAAAVAALLNAYFLGSARTAQDTAALLAIAGELAQLDGIGPEPSLPSIIEALELGIEAQQRSVGVEGSAVTVGPISDGSGRDLDISIIVGMAEGIVPAVRREDPLLPDAVTGFTQSDQLLLQRRALELAIGAGRKERILSFPRGSLRGGAEKVPSRWLLPTLDALVGSKVSETDWQLDTQGCEQVVVLEAFDAGMRREYPKIGSSAATATEWRVRAQVDESGAAPQIAVVRELRADRLSGRFTRFTGNLAAAAEHIEILDSPLAPTRLEEWVSSPYLFFIQRILRVAPLEDPDEDTQIDPLRRGDLVHQILEDYVKEVIADADGGLPRLLAIGDAWLGAAAAGAPGWLPQVWARDARVIREDLETWHALDVIERAQGWRPLGAESGFGAEGQTPVSLDLEQGAMAFLGKIDRIDRHDDGRIRVTDYKTGGSKYSQDLVEANPTANTTKFQLPVYGLFGRTLAGEADVTARYWFATSKGDFAPIGYPITDHVIEVLRRDLSYCQQSIRAGIFPPRLGSLSVSTLAGLLGAGELNRTWNALRGVPALADLVAIHEGEGL